MSSGLVDPNDPPLPEAGRRAAVLRNLLRQSPSSKPGSPQSKRRPLSPDSAAKFALKLRLNDAPVSILVPRSTQIGASLRFECKSTTVIEAMYMRPRLIKSPADDD